MELSTDKHHTRRSRIHIDVSFQPVLYSAGLNRSGVCVSVASAQSANHANSDGESSSPPMILIVDDNQHVTRALSAVIRRAGFDPVPCLRGEEALTHCQRAAPAA